jgi:hypothetical protein
MHYYERNITDIKDEYTNFFIYITSPLIYEGIKSMYIKSIEKEKECVELSKTDPRAKNPGVLKIFQHFLKNIPTLNANLIESEMIRIRDSSKHADIFEKLIKAVMKSHIILLTYNSSGKQCKLVNEKLHEKIDIKTFIHKIYVECARQFYNSPELFWHGFQPLELKKNQRECIKIIDDSIKISIKEMLPMNDIITEYLRNDYVPEETEQQKIERIRNMLNKNQEDNINFFDEEEKKVLLTEEENNDENNDDYIDRNINDIENLLNDNNDNDNDNNVNVVSGGAENNINDNMNEADDNNVEQVKTNDNNFNEEEFKEKLNNFGQTKFKNNRQTNAQTPRPPQNQQNQNNSKVDINENISDNNINIVKNNIDDRNYYTSLLMN